MKSYILTFMPTIIMHAHIHSHSLSFSLIMQALLYLLSKQSLYKSIDFLFELTRKLF